MCRVLQVSRSGYYRWLNRKPSQRQLDNQRLDEQIREIYDQSKGRYGSPKITQELRDQGHRVGKNRVANRMRKAGLRSKVRRKYRVTTNSKHNLPVAPNLLERNFTAPAPDKVWVSDITYLATTAGWLYLTVIIDVFSRKVVGWALSSSLGHEMVVTAFKRAIRRRRPGNGLIFHSDRGVQYACGDFRKELAKHEFIQSMSRKGGNRFRAPRHAASRGRGVRQGQVCTRETCVPSSRVHAGPAGSNMPSATLATRPGTKIWCNSSLTP